MTPYTKVILFLILALLVLSSCQNYYKVRSVTRPTTRETAAKLDSLSTTNRYLVLRNGTSDAYRITKLRVQDDGKAAMYLDSVSAEHRIYLSGVGGGRYRKTIPQQVMVLNEAHVYVSYDSLIKRGEYVLNLDQVERTEIIEKDTKRSTNSHVLGTMGIAFGALLIGTVIVLSSIDYR